MLTSNQVVGCSSSRVSPTIQSHLPISEFSSSLAFAGVDLAVVRCSAFLLSTMTRGNQREKDRERAQARAGSSKAKQSKSDGLTPEQRRERDAKALQEKAAKKAAQEEGGKDAGGSKNKK
ncbi:hypothetical protein SLE2022_210120 [Rubroshorea leprosula]